MNCQEMTYRLNRLYSLYAKSITFSKPYRIHKMRALYEDFLAMAGRQLEFVELAGMENYELLLGIQPALPGLLKRKNDAISKADYETAASLRDQEKAYIRFMITQNGMNGDDNFFCHDEKIFFKTW